MDEKLHADKMIKIEAMFMKKLCPSMPYAEQQARWRHEQTLLREICSL